jgi:hypothetical protein
MVSHKFAVGDRVRLTLDRYVESSPLDIHTVSRRLPPEANVCQYRVKRVSDGQERTVTEPQIVAVRPDANGMDPHIRALEAQRDLQRTRNAGARARSAASPPIRPRG